MGALDFQPSLDFFSLSSLSLAWISLSQTQILQCLKGFDFSVGTKDTRIPLS